MFPFVSECEQMNYGIAMENDMINDLFATLMGMRASISENLLHFMAEMKQKGEETDTEFARRIHSQIDEAIRYAHNLEQTVDGLLAQASRIIHEMRHKSFADIIHEELARDRLTKTLAAVEKLAQENQYQLNGHN